MTDNQGTHSAEGNSIALNGWEEFEKYLQDGIPPDPFMLPTTTLFRGQADAHWPLSTTLERHLGHRMSVLDYYRRI